MTTEQSIQRITDDIYRNDREDLSKTHHQFVASVDPALFDALARVLAPLEGDEMKAACRQVRVSFGRPLECDQDYGHWGIGMAGIERLGVALANADGISSAHRAEIMHTLSGGSPHHLHSAVQAGRKLAR